MTTAIYWTFSIATIFEAGGRLSALERPEIALRVLTGISGFIGAMIGPILGPGLAPFLGREGVFLLATILTLLPCVLPSRAFAGPGGLPGTTPCAAVTPPSR
ncbi:MAG: hypothetical protein ACXIVE_02310 [Salinarimonas sp.]